MSNPTLSATYTSPASAPFALSHDLASASASAAPSSYLASLRTAAASLQDGINKELTQRMEEDKARASAAAGAPAVPVDEDKEEENYGEEVQDEEES